MIDGKELHATFKFCTLVLSLAACGAQSSMKEGETSFVVMCTPQAYLLWSAVSLLCGVERWQVALRHDHDGG
jgi:hypothetical protein